VANAFRREVHELVCGALDPVLSSIADSYDDFHPLAEVEILGALAQGRAGGMGQAAVVVADVTVETADATIEASLTLPRAARGIVVVPCFDGIDWSGSAPRFQAALDDMGHAPWKAGLPLGVLALGQGGRALVASVTPSATDRTLPSFCLADDSAANEAAVYFRACFGRGLISV
jgi:hypothetical protein